MKRKDIINKVESIVINGREETHGKPENSFGDIAKLWSVYLGKEINPHDVTVLMSLLKVARIKNNPKNMDNWVDLAGYTVCGGELAHVFK